MKSLLSPPGRRMAVGVAGVLVAGSAAIVSTAPAQAAPATGELTWNVSQQFIDQLSTRTLSGGAAFEVTEASFTFPAAAVSTDATGSVTRSYVGTVKGAFAMGATEYYSVTITDPVVVTQNDGDGRIEATVSAANAAAQGNAADSTRPAEVTVAEFSGATTAGGTVTATPRWTDVLPAGSQRARELGISDPTRPVDGQSFHPDFLGALTSGVRAHFHATGAASDPKKQVGDISATAAMTPTVTTAVTSSTHADGVTVKVDGVGFNATTNPGDAGVYVGLAPADAVIDFDDRGAAGRFAAVDWVMPSRFTGDTFTTVVNAPTSALVPGKQYAVWTWQAHTHSNTSQDTKTAVAIDWSTLQPPAVVPPVVTPPTTPAPAPVVKSKTKAKVSLGKRRAGKTLRAVVKIRGGETSASGKVRVVLKRSGKKVRKTTLELDRSGRAVLKVAKRKVKPGTWKVRIAYGGDETHKRARAVKKFRVRG